MAGVSVAGGEIVLANRRSVAVRCEPILDGSVAVGVVMHLNDRTGRGIGRRWVSQASTEIERAIADLVAQGLTNRQIADECSFPATPC